MGRESLEVFRDVILPIEIDQEFKYDFYPINEDCSTFSTNYCPSLDFISPSEPSQIETETAKPNVTIKLRKVRYKDHKQNKFTHDGCDKDAAIIMSPDYRTVADSEDKTNESSGLYMFPDQLDTISQADFLSIENTHTPLSSPITLKDVFNSEMADDILADYLDIHNTSAASGQAEAESPVDGSWSEAHDGSEISGTCSPTLSEAEFSDLSFSPGSCYLPSPSESSSWQGDDHFPPPSLADGRSRKVQRTKKGRQKMSVESRYLRKKEQNKRAALRYRAKKKRENEEIHKCIDDEERNREELEGKYKSLKQEVLFMKNFMKEFCISKKLVAPDAFV